MINLHYPPIFLAEPKTANLPAHNPGVPSSGTPPSNGSPRQETAAIEAGPGPEEVADSVAPPRAPATPAVPRPIGVTLPAGASRRTCITPPTGARLRPIGEWVPTPRLGAGQPLARLAASSPALPPVIASPVAPPLARALPAAAPLSVDSSPLANIVIKVDRLTMKDLAKEPVAANTLEQAAAWKWDGGNMHASILLPEASQVMRGEAPVVAMGRAYRNGGYGRIRRAVTRSGEGQRLSAKALRLSDGIVADQAAKKAPKTKYTRPKSAFHELALLAAPFTELSVKGVLRFKHHLYVLSEWLPHSLSSLLVHLALPHAHKSYPGMVGSMDSERQNLGVVLETMSQIGGQLSRLHQNNWVHRDIKPANILLADQRNLSLVLGDFGLAVNMPNGVGLTHGVAGTPGYLSPEMVTESGYTFSTDTFSLGVMLANQLAGAKIFSALHGMTRTARDLLMLQHARALTLWHGNTFEGHENPIPAELRRHVGHLDLVYEEAQDADAELATYLFRNVLDPEPSRRVVPAAIAAYSAQRLSEMPELQLHTQQMMDSLNANDEDAKQSRREFALLESLHRDVVAIGF